MIALAFPNLDQCHRETIACDYLIDALAEPDFVLKIGERAPDNLDEALRIALQLEVCTKDVERCRERPTKSVPQERRVRETGKEPAAKESTEALTKRMTELEAQIQRLQSPVAAYPVPIAMQSTPKPVIKMKEDTVSVPNGNRAERKPIECFGCGGTGHIRRECPEQGTAKAKKSDGPSARPVHTDQSRSFMTVTYKSRRIWVLLDTGSDVTLCNRQIA